MMPETAAAAAASSASNISSSSDGESSRLRHRAQGDAERAEQQQHTAAPQTTSAGVLGKYERANTDGTGACDGR